MTWQRGGALALSLLILVASAPAQKKLEQSIGGREHEDNVLGVKLGMDVSTALKAVFDNTKTQPAPQKPDALKPEGKDKQDVRVVYKKLKEGELQILFAGGTKGFVREIVLVYASPPLSDDLRLAYTGNIGEAIEGDRYDDRYSIGYTDASKFERFWWRDEKTAYGYSERIGFVSIKVTKPSARFVTTVVRKIISVTPGDEAKFEKSIQS